MSKTEKIQSWIRNIFSDTEPSMTPPWRRDGVETREKWIEFIRLYFEWEQNNPCPNKDKDPVSYKLYKETERKVRENIKKIVNNKDK